MAAAGHRVVRTSGTGHAGTISVTARGAPRPQNAMKPRFQRVLTRWKPGFTASGTRASSHGHHKLRGTGSGPPRCPIVVVVRDMPGPGSCDGSAWRDSRAGAGHTAAVTAFPEVGWNLTKRPSAEMSEGAVNVWPSVHGMPGRRHGD